MIALTRRQAQSLRAVLRPRLLGATSKAHAQPLRLRADADAGRLRIRHLQPHSAIEHALEHACRTTEEIALPLEALADLAASSDETVTLESDSPRRTIARWRDRGIPQVREYAIAAIDSSSDFPAPPDRFQPCDPRLLDALAEACAAAHDADSTRYALECLQLQGESGRIVATDGRQMLIQGGFAFPWSEEVLVKRSPLLTSKPWPRHDLITIAIGKTDSHVALRIGAWMLWLAIPVNVRYPKIDQIVAATEARIATLRLDPSDSTFLLQSLDRLPGEAEAEAPITLDLGAQAVVRAQAEGETSATELILSRSVCSGSPLRVCLNRRFLRRASQLGFAEISLAGPEQPISCRDERRTYLWQPLSRDGAIEPITGAVRIASRDSIPEPPRSRIEQPALARVRSIATRQAAMNPATSPEPEPIEIAPLGESVGGGWAGLIQEAESLRRSLGEAKERTGRLIGSLRRERKRSRLVQSTLAALRQLRLAEPCE